MKVVHNQLCTCCDGYVRQDQDKVVALPICCMANSLFPVCVRQAADVQAGRLKLKDWNVTATPPTP